MCAYISKSEDEISEAMKQAAKEAFDSNKTNIEQMRSIARAYATKRACSVQEAVYLLISELWLRKTFPGVVFANSNLEENLFRIWEISLKLVMRAPCFCSLKSVSNLVLFVLAEAIFP